MSKLSKGDILIIIAVVSAMVFLFGFMFINIAKSIDQNHELDKACVNVDTAHTPICLKRTYRN